MIPVARLGDPDPKGPTRDRMVKLQGVLSTMMRIGGGGHARVFLTKPVIDPDTGERKRVDWSTTGCVYVNLKRPTVINGVPVGLTDEWMDIPVGMVNNEDWGPVLRHLGFGHLVLPLVEHLSRFH